MNAEHSVQSIIGAAHRRSADSTERVEPAVCDTPRLPGRCLLAGLRLRSRPDRNLARRGFHWWNRQHPTHQVSALDRQLGIDTGGTVPGYLLQSGRFRSADASITAYLGIAPNVLRTALAVIPDHSTRAFVDLGAGKGRALAIASEFGFREVVGIELNAELCRVAVRNAAVIRQRHPERPPIVVRQGDASVPELPSGPVVVLQYHSIGADLVRRLADHLAADELGREVLLVYANPVHGAELDGHAAFSRWYGEQIVEGEYDPQATCAVVIWRVGKAGVPASRPLRASDADRRLVVTRPGWRVDLA